MATVWEITLKAEAGLSRPTDGRRKVASVVAQEVELDPEDPQAIRVYRAQTAVIAQHAEDELASLSAVRSYITELAVAEGVPPPACRLLLRHSGGPDHLVDLRDQEGGRTGERIALPDGREATILEWGVRLSHYDAEHYMIGVGAQPGRPLSHRLLIAHEMAHLKRPTKEGHSREWVAMFRAVTARRLPHLDRELRIALRREGVITARGRREP